MSLAFFVLIFFLGMASENISYKAKGFLDVVLFHIGLDFFYALTIGVSSEE